MLSLKSSLAISLSLVGSLSAFAENQPNVLFIAVDDLNDWVGCLGGHPQAITPNLDRLAKEGVLFSNAHCQAPLCAPSRAAIMTGISPTTSGFYLLAQDPEIRKVSKSMAEAVFLPDWFEQSGYKSMGAGKIFHNGGADAFDIYENRGGSPKPPERIKWPVEGFATEGTSTDWAPYGEDEEMKDFRTAAFAVDQLQQKHDKPFFLAAGFFRPHVPWHVPQKWFDMYPPESLETPAYLKDDMDDVPELGRRLAEMPMMPTTEWAMENGEWRNIIQAYLACVTFVDAQVGKVLDALQESEYADNTIVVLWSDHGYHIGEKNRFAKQSLWERSTRTLLVFKAPGKASGQTCTAPVELLDIYPTLLELCELPENPQTEGDSLVPLLENTETPWDHVAITTYGPGNLSMRNHTHRYILYEDGSEELYDMVNDPNEWENLAAAPESDPIKAEFKKSIPTKQAPLSPHTGYWPNDYLRSVSNAARGKK